VAKILTWRKKGAKVTDADLVLMRVNWFRIKYQDGIEMKKLVNGLSRPVWK